MSYRIALVECNLLGLGHVHERLDLVDVECSVLLAEIIECVVPVEDRVSVFTLERSEFGECAVSVDMIRMEIVSRIFVRNTPPDVVSH